MKTKEDRPLVSITMPCYNHEAYVANAIESILNQTYPNLELIVLDNGSTDGSYEVIQRYSDKIKILRFEDNNPYKAGVILRQECNGKYIAGATSDDIWAPDKIEKQVEVLENNNNIRVCFTWAEFVDEQGDKIDGMKNLFLQTNKTRFEWIEHLIINGNCLACPSMLADREYYEMIADEIPSLWQLPDLYMWIKILMKDDIYVINEVLMNFLWHPHGDNANMSTPNIVTEIRTYNETVYIIQKVIAEMEDAVFLQSFYRYLKKEEISSHMDVLCEKFFLLKEMGEYNQGLQQAAINFFFDATEKGNGMLDYLEREYSYSFSDFRDYSGQKGWGAFSHDYNVMLNKMEDINKLSAKIEEMMKTYIV